MKAILEFFRILDTAIRVSHAVEDHRLSPEQIIEIGKVLAEKR